MSRIGKAPITLPEKVEVSSGKNNLITVKGPKGTLTQQVSEDITVRVEDGKVIVERPTEQKRHRAMHGLYRALIANMIKGVTEGWNMKLELVGVGYKATVTNNILDMSLGYSHSIYFACPDEVTCTAETAKGKNPVITLVSIDKQLIGQVAAKLRALRKVEPYKGKEVGS